MFKVSVYFYSGATVLHNSVGGWGGTLLQLLAVVGTGLCCEVNRTPVTELTVPGSGLGAEQNTLLRCCILINGTNSLLCTNKQIHKYSFSLLSTGSKHWFK